MFQVMTLYKIIKLYDGSMFVEVKLSIPQYKFRVYIDTYLNEPLHKLTAEFVLLIKRDITKYSFVPESKHACCCDN